MSKMSTLVIACLLFALSSNAFANGKVKDLVGSARSVFDEEKGSSKTLAAGDQVNVGDLLVTESRSRVIIEFSDQSTVSIGEKSKIRITEALIDAAKRTRNFRVELLSGKMRAAVTKLADFLSSDFVVSTPNATAGVRGTDFSSSHTQGVSRFVTFEGEVGVLLTAPATDLAIKEVVLRAGQAIVANQDTFSGTVQSLSPAELDAEKAAFKPSLSSSDEASESSSEEQAIVVSEAAQAFAEHDKNIAILERNRSEGKDAKFIGVMDCMNKNINVVKRLVSVGKDSLGKLEKLRLSGVETESAKRKESQLSGQINYANLRSKQLSYEAMNCWCEGGDTVLNSSVNLELFFSGEPGDPQFLPVADYCNQLDEERDTYIDVIIPENLEEDFAIGDETDRDNNFGFPEIPTASPFR